MFSLRLLLRESAIVLALASVAVPAAAQRTFPEAGSAPHSALPGPNATPPKADQHSSDGTTNSQPVPGAWPGSDTVPSTMLERNAADDKLGTAAFTFRNLTTDEQKAIVAGLNTTPNAARSPLAATAVIGVELPSSVVLRPVPDAVASKVPQAKGYDYVVAGDKVLLVQPPTRFVVAVLAASKATTTGSR